MTQTLTERLRAAANYEDSEGGFCAALLREAANALDTLTATLREREAEIERLKVIQRLDRHALEQFMPCPDCRDKVRHEGCQRCARQRAESKLSTLTAAHEALKAERLAIAGLVNGYHNGQDVPDALAAFRALRAVADILGPPMEPAALASPDETPQPKGD